MPQQKDDRLLDRRPHQLFRIPGDTETVMGRLAKARQEQVEKLAFAQKLTAAPKRRK
ncbi:hypothetical protein [Paracidovorax wautersii]|uniref:hypothetical protein n=1 Tax=Paracidovorax wautersii TaxID=1177982 RepID=UPI001587A407|nr:hypothetical protein [Paracidovorax wautersii]